MPDNPYAKLEARFRRVSLLEEANSVLSWDRATFMPRGGAAARSEQITELGLIRHELMTETCVADWLDAAEADASGLDSWQRRNLAAMRRRWRHAAAVPAELDAAAARAGLACEMAWREARPADDFPSLAPLLEIVLKLTREIAEAKGAAFGCEPYDAMLDQYQPGLRVSHFAPVFETLATFLPDFIDNALSHQASLPPRQQPTGPFPIAAQRKLARTLMRAVGFPFDHGRLDSSAHPFSGGTPDDLRVTTRYDEADFSSALMAALHETGHALYEHNLPRRWRHQPVGEALGMAVHESQSLLIETQIGRSRGFFIFAAPLIQQAFNGASAAWNADTLRQASIQVARSPIRVDADEATYPVHILLRTQLEQDLLSGALAVGDLPGAWRDGMRHLLDMTPETDRDGCLQDIHWMEGAFGYFPTYTLGAIMAAQLYSAARAANSCVEPGIAAGDFTPVMTWLKTNVHEHASSSDMATLLKRATGRGLDLGAYIDHLRARYLA